MHMGNSAINTEPYRKIQHLYNNVPDIYLSSFREESKTSGDAHLKIPIPSTYSKDEIIKHFGQRISESSSHQILNEYSDTI
jgi:hypothetical protein